MLKGDIEGYILSNTVDNNLIRHQSKYIYDCLYGTDKPIENQFEKLDMVSSINKNTPPAFIWTTRNDEVIDPRNATEFVHRMQEKQINCEYHLFEEGKHGLSLATELYANNKNDSNIEVSMWIPLVINWLKKQCEKSR